MSNNLPKGDLAAFVATDAGVTKAQAQAVLDALGAVVRTNAANGYIITLPGLGRFSETVRAARTARNPSTGQPVEVPEARVLAFKAMKPKTACAAPKGEMMNTITIINIAKGQLGLDEDTYRAILQRVTGVASLRMMTERQRISVLEEMKRQGFVVKVGGKKLPASVKPFVRKSYPRWSNCYRLGVIEDRSRPALRAVCKRFVAHGMNNAVVDPDMLSYQQAEPIIEALKRM